MSNQSTDAGSRFFVIGTYVQGVEMFDHWKSIGINTLVDVPQGHDRAAWVAEAQAKGLYQIRHPVGDLQTDAKNPFLLAWSTEDEPSNVTGGDLNYDTVRVTPAEVAAEAATWRDAAAKAGVDIPIWTNHVGGHIYPGWAANSAVMKDYHEGPESDWLASDSYPVQNGQPLLTTASDNGETYVSTQQGVNAYRQETWSGGKATHTFIGSSAYTVGQPVPTAAELKAQAWSGIINGAEGIIYFPVQLAPWKFDATPAHLQTAMKQLHAEIKAIEDILMNEQTGGRAAYKVFHSAVQGATPSANQLPYGFEAAEIKTEDGGTYRIILNITSQERTLNKPEWGLNNVKFAAYGLQKGADGSAPVPTPTDPEPMDPVSTNPVPTDPETPETPADANDLVLTVSGDQLDGAPTFDVKVDGKVVATGLRASADHKQGQWADVKVSGDFSAAKTVEVTFTNDLWGGSLQADRNMYVDKIAIGGKVVQAEASTVSGTTIVQGSDVFLRSSGDSVSFSLTGAAPTPTEPKPTPTEPTPSEPTPTKPTLPAVDDPTFRGRFATGTAGNDTIIGNHLDNTIFAGAGVDVIKGGKGRDMINGGVGHDEMWGGEGRDTFDFNRVVEINGDRIQDFVSGRDKIDLRGIDANTSKRGDQAFTFKGYMKAGKSGQVWLTENANENVTYVNGKVRDTKFQLELKGTDLNLTKGDFIL